MKGPGCRRRCAGSAAIELVAIIPFALILMAAIVDLRAFAAHRADIAREIYTVAEIVAGATTWNAATAEAALRNTMQAARERLERNTAGWMRVVVVARPRDNPGDPTATPSVPATTALNSDGNPCNPAAPATPPFCEPEVLWELDTDTVATGAQRAIWNGGGDCGASAPWAVASQLPAEAGAGILNARFPRGTPPPNCAGQVLPNECADPDGAGPAPAPAHSDWVSRTLDSEEWWAVVEVCTHFAGGTSQVGLFEGGMAGFAMDAFSARAVLLRRVAWGALESLNDCTWCGAIGAGGTP